MTTQDSNPVTAATGITAIVPGQVSAHFSRQNLELPWRASLRGLVIHLSQKAVLNLDGQAKYAEPLLQLATEQVGYSINTKLTDGAVAATCDNNQVVVATACQIIPELRVFFLVGARVVNGSVSNATTLKLALPASVSLKRYAHYAAMVYARELVQSGRVSQQQFVAAFNVVMAVAEQARAERMQRDAATLIASQQMTPTESVFTD